MGFTKTAVRKPVFDPTELPSIEQVNLPTGRFYRTPDGDFPSVTRFLGETDEDTGWLDEWRARVGDVEARRITEEAVAVGNYFHDLNESWITGRHPSSPYNAEGRALHIKTRPLLNRYARFLAVETALWSAKLGLAGTVDFVARDVNGELVIGDFKNSRRGKNRDDIDNYWCQVCLYGIMWWSLTGDKPDRCDIVIGNRQDSSVVVYSESFGSLIESTIGRVKKWKLGK